MVENEVIFYGFKEDWEQIQSINQHSYAQSKQQQQWSMVVIRDFIQKKNDDLSVFPPINHENLHNPSRSYNQDQQPSPSPSLSSLSFLSSDADTGAPPATPFDCRVRGAGGINCWWDVLLGALRSKILKVASLFFGSNKGATRGPFWSFYPAVGVSTLVIWWWLCAGIRRRPYKGESVDQLTLIIREKDEKIIQLLHQIAQMNEVLLARHKVLASKLSN